MMLIVNKRTIMRIFIISFSISFSILIGENLLPPKDSTDWETLQDGKIWIGWMHHGDFDWCRAKSTISAPFGVLQNILEDKKNYPQVFKRIEKIEIITEDIVYIALDMPFPFSGRDYIVKYIKEKDENDFVYHYHAVMHSAVPMNKKYVRLIHSTGEWRITYLGSNKTEITYTWNGELLGDFPDWALSRAWKQQGLEVITWIQEAVKN